MIPQRKFIKPSTQQSVTISNSNLHFKILHNIMNSAESYRLWYAYNFLVTTLNKKEKKMPKLKTHRSAAKRYKVTATGKIMKRQAGIGHLLQHKSASRKRRIFKMVGVSESHVALVSKELPYKKYSR